MVRLHIEAARAVEGEPPRGRLPSLHRQLVAGPTNMGVDLIVGIAGHIQDHLLTNPCIDLLPARSVFPPAMVMLMVMLMVSVSSLTDGELAELDAGAVAGEDGPLGLPTAVRGGGCLWLGAGCAPA
jgi:hypothetical protein